MLFLKSANFQSNLFRFVCFAIACSDLIKTKFSLYIGTECFHPMEMIENPDALMREQ